MQVDLTGRILAFPNHLDFGADARRSAQARGWLDDGGRPTDLGRSLVSALGDQDGTRKVFRSRA